METLTGEEGSSMDELRIDELKELIGKCDGVCVSIFMPTFRTGNETEQNPVRFKNLLSLAEERLAESGIRSPEAKNMIEPCRRILSDRAFWQRQGDGLAVFISPGTFLYYRLPVSFQERVVVGSRFHLRPLLPALTGDGRFYLLALSQNKLRIYEGSMYTMSEMSLKGAPRSLAEALKYDDPQKQLQFHTGAPKAGAQRAAMFHGHGVGTDDEKDNVLRFFQQVDKGVHELLKDEHAPLVLAGAEHVIAIYREANSYPYLVEEGIRGNPELVSVEDLHRQAWGIIEPHFLRARGEAAARFRELAGTGRASEDFRVIVKAAHDGRVDTLFAALDAQQWGSFDPDSGTVQLIPESEPNREDLVDLAAVRTLINRGAVYIVEQEKMPSEAPLAALFRY